MLQEHLVSVLENKTIIFQMTTQSVLTFMNTFRPLAKKQMHTFSVEDIILGPEEVIHIIFSIHQEWC